jgi:hypothetical protein
LDSCILYSFSGQGCGMPTLYPRLGSLNLFKGLANNKFTVMQSELLLESIKRKKHPLEVNLKSSISKSTLGINVIVLCIIVWILCMSIEWLTY